MYIIKNLDEDQCRVIVRALDLYARIGLGQLEVVGEHMQHFAKKQNILYYKMCDSFRALKPTLTGLDMNSSYGIGCKDVPEDRTHAFDIMQVIRHRLAWDRDPDGGTTVDFYPPMQWGTKPLPEMEGGGMGSSPPSPVPPIAIMRNDKDVPPPL